MPMNYYSRKNGTLASRLDQAWLDYQNPAYQNHDRQNALHFMAYVFDIQVNFYNPDRLNKILTALMERRAEQKDENPEYIPILRSGRYHLENKACTLNPTHLTKLSPVPWIQEAFDNNQLLDVNQESKRYDRTHPIESLSPEERSAYNIEIYGGRFQRKGRLFNTRKFKAHGKNSFAAFTFNTNGELSVFNHLGGRPDRNGKVLLHSSMNSGAPVLAAGEILIQHGKLIAINTYSGHYQPNLYNLALFLEYLSDRNISLENTQIFLINPPHPKSGLSSRPQKCLSTYETWYAVHATDVIFSVKRIIQSNIESINDYLKSPKTYQRLVSNQGTIRSKCELATELKQQLEYVMMRAKDSFSLIELKVTLKILKHIIKKYQSMCENIGRKGRLDKKLDKIRLFLNKTKHELGQNLDLKDQERKFGFQNSC